MNDEDAITCPPELEKHWCARATYLGDIQCETIQLEDLIAEGRKAVEIQKEQILAAGDVIKPWAVIGVYRTQEEASAALDWVRAWRDGS